MNDIVHKTIILIGAQHVGKSTVASLLSQKLSLPFFDTDDAILSSQISGTTIRALYIQKGRTRFQQLEYEAIHGMPMPCVCATGGGIVDNTHAWKWLADLINQQKAILVLLSTDPNTVWQRIVPYGIPAYLLEKNITKKSKDARTTQYTNEQIITFKKKFIQIFERRMRIYKKYAHIVTDTTALDELDEIVANIMSKL